MNSHAAHVIVESDICSEAMLVKVSDASDEAFRRAAGTCGDENFR
jgi:hypothetical protein